jgi:hypothetical protein
MPLPQVTGANCRRIRTEVARVTQDRLASEAVRVGLPWTAARIAQFEKGDVSLTLPTLVLLSAALDAVTPVGHTITLVSLLVSDKPIELVPGISVSPAALVGAVKGGSASAVIPSSGIADPGDSPVEREVHFGYGRADSRLADQLGLPKAMMVKACAQLWGHAMSVERDKRAGLGADRRRVGLVTRELAKEIDTEVTSWAEPRD